ncbi:MAG: hypothetical protein HY807_06990 [Nitrospirae bacterium]|nr:hypothetical protein [Nitrospirota bacterium]
MSADSKTEIAQELREAFNTVSPFIEKHTSIVCPGCKNICCADRHGRYDSDDIIFLKAIGADFVQDHSGRDENSTCRFMTATGCSLVRWMRPFRCTFFFCNPLLKSLENDNAKLYRAFMDYFKHLVDVRQNLIGEDIK